MARFPRIQSPCPYVDRLDAIMDGTTCRMCAREVIDIGAMSDDTRVAFLRSCTQPVCVSYRLPLRPALAAAALAASAIVAPTAAAAQAMDEIVVMAGGITDPANVEFVEDPADAAIPELPVFQAGEEAPRSSPVIAATTPTG